MPHKNKNKVIFGITKCKFCKTEYSFNFNDIETSTECYKCKKNNTNLMTFNINEGKRKFELIKDFI